MANDKENYKEGVDYKVVDKGGYKTRHFFTRAEKAAMKAPKATTKPVAPKAVPKATTAKAKGAPVAKVTTSPLPSDLAAATRKAISSTAKTVDKKSTQPKRPVTSQRIAGPFTRANLAALGDYTESAYNNLTPSQRASRGLPSTLGGYAAPPGTFKVIAEADLPPRPKRNKTRKLNYSGQYATVGYAKGGMTKKKKAC